jgi:hypothetical protein
MPKVYGTKKKKAEELLRDLRNGPAFSNPFVKIFTPEDAAAAYKLWAETWIIRQVIALVPQLKDKKGAKP